MISAVNPRLQLSGNNCRPITVIIFILLILVSSCSPTKKLTDQKSLPESDKKKEKAQDPKKILVDTVKWTEKQMDAPSKFQDSSQSTAPVKTEKSKLKNTKLSKNNESFHIVTLLPVKWNETDTLNSKIASQALRYLHFYAGMEMAADELQGKLSKPIKITTHLVSDSMELESALKKYESNLPHLIVAPQKAELVKYTATWGLNHETSVISPWVSGSSIAETNPYYIQIKPTLIAQYKFINDEVRRMYPIQNAILILREEDETKELYFNNNQYPQKMQVKVLKESDLITAADPIIQALLKESGSTVFILPMGSIKDENFIYHFLRRVSAEKESKDVVVFGMSKWLEMKSDIIDQIQSQKVLLSASNFIDNESSELKYFKRKYFDHFREFPSNDVLEGYDLMNYCLQYLSRYGPDFHLIKNAPPLGKYYQTNFDLEPVYKENNKDKEIPDYYENAFLKMVELKGNRIRIVE